MWITTTEGFFSCVQHRKKPDHLLVRARRREDLEHCGLDHEISMDATADYLYRMTVPKQEWADYLTTHILAIDYDNFKSAVGARQGQERAHIYMQVWHAMRELEQMGRKFTSKPAWWDAAELDDGTELSTTPYVEGDVDLYVDDDADLPLLSDSYTWTCGLCGELIETPSGAQLLREAAIHRCDQLPARPSELTLMLEGK